MPAQVVVPVVHDPFPTIDAAPVTWKRADLEVYVGVTSQRARTFTVRAAATLKHLH